VIRADQNKFNEIPQTIALNRNVTEMTFDDNFIQNVPQIFRRMDSLQRLNLQRNRFKTIPMVFMEWTSLTELRLKGNPLYALPLNFTVLLTIKVAEFDWEHLMLPPQEVAQQGNKVVLEYLTRVDQAGKKGTLNLQRMRLSDFPVHATSLERLQLVSLSDNEIRVLGEHISTLQKLEVLELDRNMMPSMPRAVCTLANLTALNVAKNKLFILPVDIGKLYKLEKLICRENQLKELPESFMQLTNLTHLHLGYNKLSELPKTIGGVDYSAGPFVELFLGGMRKLVYLDVSHNEIEEIPKSIRGLTSLTRLQMHENRLHTLPDRLKVLKKCDKLSIDVKSLTVLKKLKVDNLNLAIQPPPEVILRGTDTLVSFYKKILKVENSKRLSLDGLHLKNFPEEITVMTDLLHLSLAHNKIREIPVSILKIKDLETLDLRDNKIHRLPRMARFEGLAEFYIQNNNLAYIPPSVGLMTDLEVLNFSNNPLQDPPSQIILAGNAEVMSPEMFPDIFVHFDSHPVMKANSKHACTRGSILAHKTVT
jgi:Leucine-rich repeat (LRR) protein